MSDEPVIALIDDDVSFRIALQESLLSFGYSVDLFASADDFVATDAGGPYDCIITDINMPGMSGIELARVLAARGSRIPIIMITAHAESDDLDNQARLSGAFGLLRKPFETKLLIAWLQRVAPD